jgi:glucokinase
VNDLGAITVGEAGRGAGRGATHAVCVFVGTGVGMGAVVGGRLLEGHDGLAAELGHAKVASPETGRRCGCGERGCLEAYTSGRHLPDLLAEKIDAGLESERWHRGDDAIAKTNAAEIEEAAKAGDAAAQAVWQDAAEYLAEALGTVVAVLSPRVLVLGGGVLRLAPSLRERVGIRLQAYAPRPELGDLLVRDSELGDDAGLVGAGLLAHQSAASGHA